MLSTMHIITKPALVAFWKKHPDAKLPLQAWYRIMSTQVFADFNDLRATFASADYVNGLTVFNIGGNKYRLIAAIHYNRRKVYIRHVLTHSEYDRDGWQQRKRK
jgi:mRNA interferase HigB